jgi:crotonobetainyl-CoA:carnitine CoA-transferase CaiB-like acyl-CoA transferase
MPKRWFHSVFSCFRRGIASITKTKKETRVSEGLFKGLKVIDCASYIAAPAAATVMSDFGAEVIKIEPPGAGDPYRNPANPSPVRVSPVNPNWLMDSRNKKSLALNLASESGHAVLRKLVAGADVFITNYPPKVRKKLKLAYGDMAPLNDRLIYASFTGFGETGPDADKPGFDATVWWARSGLMDLTREITGTPVRSPPGAGDHPSAMGFYSAIITALYKREKTGKGSHVGSSLLMNGLWSNACSIQTTICGEEVSRIPERSQHPMPWRNSYQCSDGRWLVLSIVHNDARWAVFTKALNSPLMDDSRFQSNDSRKEHAVAIVATLDKVFATKTCAEWCEILDSHGVVFGTVASITDVPNDEQAKIAGALVPDADGVLTVSSPFWIEGEDKVLAQRAPSVGQHSDVVLAAAGYSSDDIKKLRAEGAVG